VLIVAQQLKRILEGSLSSWLRRKLLSKPSFHNLLKLRHHNVQRGEQLGVPVTAVVCLQLFVCGWLVVIGWLFVVKTRLLVRWLVPCLVA
jgi:hypothetical protein